MSTRGQQVRAILPAAVVLLVAAWLLFGIGSPPGPAPMATPTTTATPLLTAPPRPADPNATQGWIGTAQFSWPLWLPLDDTWNSSTIDDPEVVAVEDHADGLIALIDRDAASVTDGAGGLVAYADAAADPDTVSAHLASLGTVRTNTTVHALGRTTQALTLNADPQPSAVSLIGAGKTTYAVVDRPLSWVIADLADIGPHGIVIVIRVGSARADAALAGALRFVAAIQPALPACPPAVTPGGVPLLVTLGELSIDFESARGWESAAEQPNRADLVRTSVRARLTVLRRSTAAVIDADGAAMPWPDDVAAWLASRGVFASIATASVSVGGHPATWITAHAGGDMPPLFSDGATLLDAPRGTPTAWIVVDVPDLGADIGDGLVLVFRVPDGALNGLAAEGLCAMLGTFTVGVARR